MNNQTQNYVPLLTGDRPLPHNPEAERALLGQCLIRQEAVHAAAERLTAESFYNPAHRQIFAAIQGVNDGGITVELLSVCDRLTRHGHLAEIGGRSYVAGLLNDVPTSANTEYYIRQVSDCATMRRLIRVCADTCDQAYDGGDPERLLQSLYECSKSETNGDYIEISEAIGGAIDQLRAALDPANGGHLKSGMAALDNVIRFRPGEVTVLAARPSIGKTAMMLQLILNQREPCGIFSIEQPTVQLILRLLANVARVNVERLSRGHGRTADFERLIEAAQVLGKRRIYVDDDGGLTLPKLRSRGHRMVERDGVKLLAVDYLQLLRHAARGRSRENEVSEISSGVKALAKGLNVPIILLAQLNRKSESEKRKPRLTDLRESGSIEQDADIVLLLHRDTRESPEGELIIAKNRNGATGEVRLAFQPEYQMFTGLAAIDDDAVPQRADW